MTTGMPALTERTRAHGWRWLLDVALAVAVGWVMSIAWVAVATPDRMGMGMGRGRMRPEVELTWSPIVQLAVATVAVAVVLGRVLPRTGWVLGLVGVAGYLAAGGSPVAAVVAAIVLGVRLLVLSSVPVTTPGSAESDRHPSHLAPARLWPWLVALVPAYLANGLGDGHPWVSVFTTATMLVWTTLPLVAAAAFLARRGQRVRERALELEGVARAERLRLARDIHDVVGHSLSLISLQSGVALRVLDTDPTQARRSLEAIRQTSKEALAEVRTTLGVFRESDEAPLAPTPGLVAIERLVQQVASSGVSVTLTELPDPAEVPAVVQSVAHRVVQESVTNALRHAPGSPITAVAVVVGRDLRVRVADSGAPSLPIREGNGLTGMRERVRAIGGTMTIDAGPTGFAVMATLPLEPPLGVVPTGADT